jgi:hypothetical protein
MNCNNYTIPTFNVDVHQINNILHCVIHTILFHRMIYKVIKPKEIVCSAFDLLSYVAIDDIILEEYTREQIDSFITKKYNHIYNYKANKENQNVIFLTLAFYKLIKHTWPFSDEKIIYEKWNISISIYSIYDKSLSRSTKDSELNKSYQILLETLQNLQAPPSYLDKYQFLYFEIIDSEQKSILTDFINMIKTGPPRIL